MADKQTTAVEWFATKLEEKIGKSILTVMNHEIEQALEMERNQPEQE